MRLLCVGNGHFTTSSGRLLTHQHTGSFLKELADSFDQVVFMQMMSATPYDKTLNDFALDGARVNGVAAAVSAGGCVGKLISCGKALVSVLREVRNADYLYLFLPGTLSRLVSACALRLGKPYGVYLRGERGIDTQWMQRVLSGAEFVHANGGVLVRKVRALCHDVELTVPMLDLTLQDCVDRREFRAQPPWNVLYVGRVEGRKGVFELVEAARSLKQHGISFQLNIVGDGADLQRIKTRLNGELAGYIRYRGLVSDRQELFSLYKKADLFVFPSHDEGFPRVLYEAMAFQTPIVTTFVGSIPSLMCHDENCLRVDVGDPVALASAIQRALKDVELRRKIASRSSETIRRLLESNRGDSHARQVKDKVSMYVKAQ